MMSRFLPVAALCLSLTALLPACQKDTDNAAREQVGFVPAGGRPQPGTRPLPTPSTQLPPDPNLRNDEVYANATPPAPPPAAPPARPTAKDIPYGNPVPGKPGLVISPHSPDAGPIDVHGFAPGQEVVDPLTGKSFLVP